MAKKAAGDPRFDFLDKRPLFREDMNEDEQGRMDQKRREVVAAAPAVAADAAKTPAMRSALSGLSPRSESRSEVVSRLSQQMQNPDPTKRLPGEGVVPDADWYPRVHAAPLRRTAARYGLDPERVTTSSGSMSPQNEPSAERAAAAAIAKATVENSPTTINNAVKKAVVTARKGKASPVSDLPNGQVGFNEMTPEQIRDVTPAEVRNSGVLKTEIGAGISKAGTNKVNGVRGMRGAHINELAPPSSAPKVTTYARHGYTFGVPHEEDSGYKRQLAAAVTPEEEAGQEPKFDNFIAEEIRFRAAHAATQMTGQTTLDAHGLNDDTVHVTKELHDHLTAQGASMRGSQIGSSVRMRDMHPSAVLAMSHPDVSSASPDGERLQKLAKLSSQLPTVIDSHANGSIAGYPGETSKPTGSNAAGYWGQKTLNDGTSIVDSRDARVTNAGLQHADYDSLIRETAHQVVKDKDMDMDYPSTAVQAGIWTEDRKAGGHDAAFNQATSRAAKAAAKEAKAAETAPLRGSMVLHDAEGGKEVKYAQADFPSVTKSAKEQAKGQQFKAVS